MAEVESPRVRHRKIYKILRDAGFIRPSPLVRLGRHSPSPDQPSSARLRETLEKLGPLFTVFGVYLSTRLELMPLSDSLELARIDQSGGSPARDDEVSGLVCAELGRQPNEIFQRFQYLPAKRSLVYQWHRATLKSGEDVLVKILHPRFEALVSQKTELLTILEKIVITGQDGVEFGLPGMAEDFSLFLDHHLDLGMEAAALEEMALNNNQPAGMTAPEVFGEFSSRRLITTRLLEGRVAGTESNSDGGPAAVDSARRLCLAWLYQALFGGLYPVAPFEQNIVELSDNRYAVAGGLFGRLRQNSRKTLFNYLIAASRHEPDRALGYLLRETAQDSTALSRDDLRIIFRQAEPFRTGGWGDSYMGQRLAEHLFIQWRLVNGHGYYPSHPLREFFRGLYGLELLVRQTAPHRDALKRGLDDLRVIAAAVHLRENSSLSRLKSNFEKFFPEYVELWSKVDEAATLIEGGILREPKTFGQDTGRAKGHSWLTIIGLLALFVSGILIVKLLSPSVGTPTEIIGVLALSPLAAAILFLISRRNGG